MALTKATYSMISGAVLNVFDYMTQAQRDDVSSRTASLDVAGPIQAALDDATLSGSTGKGFAVFMPSGTYRIGSTLSVPNGTVLYGAGRNQTGIRPTSGFTGVMITDKGNASKVVLRDFRIDGQGVAGVTDLIKMGYNAEPLGGAEWNNLFLYGGTVGSPASGITGINAVTNVFTFTEIEAGFCGTDFKLGPNSGVTTYTRCFTISAVNYGFQLNGTAAIKDCEIEAPGAACIGVYASRETVISNLTYSQAAGITNPYAIEIDASCPMFVMEGFVHIFDTGATLTNVIKDNRSGYPTNWGNAPGTLKNVSIVSDNLFLGTAGYYIQNQQRQLFQFRIQNTAGTIQHQIGSLRDVTSDSSFANKISGATSTLSNTPSGTDASTAFVAGAKISSANKSIVIFNTASQTNTVNWSGFATVNYNNSTTALNVSITTSTFNVNGVTRVYLIAQFTNAATGVDYDLTTIPSSQGVTIAVETFLV
jgi:hypothetical protein